ncbi:MAG: TetR/AcrR family transcriptional regulator [Nocardioidaceae bacterium]
MSTNATGRKRWPEGYDPARTRRQLVDSALFLFERDGFDRTSLQQIVERAGLTKGAFYHHFESKEDLLWHIQDEYLEAQIESAQEIVSNGDDPAEQVRGLIRLSMLSVAEYRAHVAIFYQERRHLTGERLEAITRKRDQVEQLFRSAVQSGTEAGVFNPELSARIVTFGIIGMCAWSFQWFRPDGKLSIESVAEQFCELVLAGLVVA